ncbi:MAG: hypothetical protein HC840_26170 [Leptolyngbyaceae cyanobacterium RM2_2_4]|nr:hypothetical protein [Leptolyngbyaceae cyanobacterium SM1_4_3]NJN90118.1 hypothetical protein [Leptolyngbyaceae cyanobacterium SL_5_14]NJO52303.1 hypothetical protein [Leptolyngbyaceae cyanobacterium RM2_2_4]NJO73147.1 hypothetical protein [Leptolyngbyaceae cyanobacterium RM1_406_9]
MQTQHSETEVKFTVSIPNVPELHQAEAEHKAKEAYVMTLLQHSDISSGKAAELLNIDRWQLSNLMDSYGISPFASQSKEEIEEEIAQAKRVLEK